MAASDYFDPSNFGTGASGQYTSNPGWGSGEESNQNVQQVQQATQLFQQQFQNLIGRPPTADELGGFQNQALYSAWNAPGNMTYGDMSGLANSYIQSAFGPQAAQYQQQQQTNQLGQSQQQMQDIINKTMGNTASALSDPNSQVYKTLSGSMNNMGISPSSGAFQAGAGSTIANSGLNAANSGLESIGIPGIQGIANTGSIPYQNSFQSGNTALGNIEGINNFGMQEQLAQMLVGSASPSSAQSILGMASGSAGGAGSLLQGGAAAKNATWICTQLKKEGLLSDGQIKILHDHLYKAFWNRPFKFIFYFFIGKLLVNLANKYNTDWRLWKSEFYDNVLAEPDPVRAVDLYSDTFWRLYMNVTGKKYVSELVR